jgi:hypothetical protein
MELFATKRSIVVSKRGEAPLLLSFPLSFEGEGD